MREVVSLVVIFIVIAIVYEFAKPKDNQSTNQQEDSEAEDK